MKLKSSSILTAAAVAGACALLVWLNSRPGRSEASAEPAVTETKKERHRPLLPKAGPAPVPAPAPEPAKRPPVVKKPAAAPAKSPPADPDERRQAAMRRYWEQQARQFDRQKEQLDREENPARRKNLIHSISRFVRVDTPGVLDWAMNMTNPEEQRMALEAINKNTLSGIGARIEVDETGFPKIKDTTVLSAVASTGQVAAGDYIVGMQDTNGKSVYFEGLSAKKVAQHLRGEPGSDITLRMKRMTAGGSYQEFDVNVKRSMLVVQPPF